MKEVSVLIPVYNGEKYIRRCIDSVINQTYKDIEIIVINDGSTDKTLDIMKEYKNIKMYTKKNEGIGTTRNYAIDKCKTKYFMFLDSDDYLEKDAIEILYSRMKTNNYDIVMGSLFDNDSKEIIIESDKYDYLFNNCIQYYMVSWNKLYKKELFVDLKYPNLKMAEDDYMIHHLLKKCNKILYVPRKTYNYNLNDNSITKKYYNYYKDAIVALKDRYLFFKKTKYEKIAYKGFMYYYIYLYCNLKDLGITNNSIVKEFKNEIVYKNIRIIAFSYFPKMYHKLRCVKRWFKK